jgi:hypothetical protein
VKKGFACNLLGAGRLNLHLVKKFKLLKEMTNLHLGKRFLKTTE